MPITLSTKTVVQLGGVAAAVTALGAFTLGAWSHVKPYTENENAPWASVAHVNMEDAKIEQVTADFHRDRDQSSQTMLFLSEGFWEQQLALAEDALRRNPSDILARQEVNHARAQLINIQSRLAKAR